MLKYFEYGGKSSEEFGLFLTSPISWRRPRRKVTTYSIPGRSGDLRILDGGYENVQLDYECMFPGNESTAMHISDWLYSSGGGYVKLRDDYHPDCFRLAAFDDGYQGKNLSDDYGKMTLTFNARPEIYLDSGDTEIVRPFTITTYKMTNPTRYAAKPLIRFVDTYLGRISITSGGTTHTTQIGTSDVTTTHEFVIDCENEVIYMDGEIFDGSVPITMTDGKFPVFYPGETTISVYGSRGGSADSKAHIKARWWTI